MNLANRLRIPKVKLGYAFIFRDAGDLIPLRGGRGKYIVYSPDDYLVDETRQMAQGETIKLEAGTDAGSGSI